MKYYKGRDEYEPQYGEGLIYFEVDDELDMVVRQVEIYERACFSGRWTGSSLEGWISDKKASQTDFAQTQPISAEEFEIAWKQANKK